MYVLFQLLLGDQMGNTTVCQRDLCFFLRIINNFVMIGNILILVNTVVITIAIKDISVQYNKYLSLSSKTS